MAKWIVNKYGVIHSLPDDLPAPAGSRPATPEEIGRWTEADEQRKRAIAAKNQAAQVAAAKVVIRADSAVGGEVGGRHVDEFRADPSTPGAPYVPPPPRGANVVPSVADLVRAAVNKAVEERAITVVPPPGPQTEPVKPTEAATPTAAPAAYDPATGAPVDAAPEVAPVKGKSK